MHYILLQLESVKVESELHDGAPEHLDHGALGTEDEGLLDEWFPRIETAARDIRDRITKEFDLAVNLGCPVELDSLLEFLFLSVVTHPDVSEWLDRQPDRMSDTVNAALDKHLYH